MSNSRENNRLMKDAMENNGNTLVAEISSNILICAMSRGQSNNQSRIVSPDPS